MNWSEFRQLVSQHFDEEELAILCFDLGIDYGNLDGERKDRKVTELIDHLRRTHRIPDFVVVLNHARPPIHWEEILIKWNTEKRASFGSYQPPTEMRPAPPLFSIPTDTPKPTSRRRAVAQPVPPPSPPNWFRRIIIGGIASGMVLIALLLMTIGYFISNLRPNEPNQAEAIVSDSIAALPEAVVPTSSPESGPTSISPTVTPVPQETVVPTVAQDEQSEAVPDPQTELPTVLRINVGSTEAETDQFGNVWEADRGFIGGRTIDRGPIYVTGSSLPIYNKERYGMQGYQLPLQNGTYVIRLHFAETYTGITRAGQRLFDVSVESNHIHSIDVFGESGGLNTALVKQIIVTVTDQQLDIFFEHQIENPEINAIEVFPIEELASNGASPLPSLHQEETETQVHATGEIDPHTDHESDHDGQAEHGHDEDENGSDRDHEEATEVTDSSDPLPEIWIPIETFDNYTDNAVLNRQNNWTAGGAFVRQDPITEGNRVIGFETPDRWFLYKTIPSIRNADTGTLFFRMYRPDAVNASIGLSDVSDPEFFPDYEVQIAARPYLDEGPNPPAHYVVRNGGDFVLIDGLTEDAWHCVWLVANNATDTFEVFTQTGAQQEPFKLSHNGQSIFSFRNGAAADLTTLYILLGPDAVTTPFLDDFFIDRATINLSDPSGNC